MSSKIDYEEINKIIQLMEDKNLSHFELEIEGIKIKLTRTPVSVSSLAPAPSAPLSQKEEKKASEQPQTEEKKDNLHYITSPMVGTLYRAPDPSSPPFVEVGDTVKKNQVLCIIEAMKLMNEIESDVDGILKEILVENGKPIEYGQKLFAIQPL